MMEYNAEKRAKIISRVSWNTVFVNLLLSVIKLAAGLFAHSSAMLSDAVHSASDVLSTFTVMIGVKLSSRQADNSHEYGHERMESVASILLAVLLCGTGLGIGADGARKLLLAGNGTLTVPGVPALAAAAASILIKEGMYWYTRSAAKKTASSALMADAWHHRSDALSSIGSLIGIAGARMGYPVMDPLASLIICLFILKVSVDIFRTSVSQVTDRSCPPQVEEEMQRIILKQEGVYFLDLLQTRQFGAKYYVDVEIAADGTLSLYEAHAIAERVHNEIEAEFPRVKHCMVHVNPVTIEP